MRSQRRCPHCDTQRTAETAIETTPLLPHPTSHRNKERNETRQDDQYRIEQHNTAQHSTPEAGKREALMLRLMSEGAEEIAL